MKNEKTFARISIIIAVAAFVAIFVYIQIQQANNSQLSSDKYIYLEHFVETKAEVVGNNNPNDLSAYNYLGYLAYNNSTALLQAKQNDYFPDINRSLMVFFTDGTSVGVGGCHGQSTYVYGVYSLPYDINDLKILKVNNEGTAFIDRYGKMITLKPEDKLVNITSTIVDARFTNATVNETIPINVTVMDRIRNFGICNKRQIRKKVPHGS